jgi:hypothetical protein
VRETHEQLDLHRDRAERDDSCRIDRGWLARGNLRGADVGAARRVVIDDHHSIEGHGRVLARNAGVLKDERRTGGIAPDDELTRGRSHLAVRQQREDYRGVVQRNGGLPNDELCAEVEGDLLARGELPAIRVGSTCTRDEDQLSTTLMEDPRVFGQDAFTGEHDVAGRRAAYGEGLLSEARYHARSLSSRTLPESNQTRTTETPRKVAGDAGKGHHLRKSAQMSSRARTAMTADMPMMT